MSIEIVKSITQSGEPWNDLYPFVVEMESGQKVEAKAKSQAGPPYHVGDQVEVETRGPVKGGPNKGMLSASIKKHDSGGGFSGGGRGGGKSGYDSKGARVGCAVTNAVNLACHGKIEVKAIAPTARQLIEIMDLLEKGTTKPQPHAPVPRPAQAQQEWDNEDDGPAF